MPTPQEYEKYKEYYDKANKKAYNVNKDYWKKRYRENPKRYYVNNLLRRQKEWAFVKRYKESKPCKDCGDWFLACQMDFDHLDKSKKKFNVGRLVCGNREKLFKEIAKCDLVCSNCHRKRTWLRLKNG